ncbi:hypothetical protein AOT82_2013 [Psychrobacter sp. AntiMn-1]|nr:hypothetical protein AOT82_2013 [Psychrobacter sp. AntiMn-1]
MSPVTFGQILILFYVTMDEWLYFKEDMNDGFIYLNLVNLA